MTDIIRSAATQAAQGSDPSSADGRGSADARGAANGRGTATHGQAVDALRTSSDPRIDHERLVGFVELFFFAYRDFTGDPDAVLEDYGFGRAHHRVLHFVCRRPGLRVADLLDILAITKQSLAPVLKQLMDEGFIEQRAGAVDRRERLLHPTEQGARLAKRLIDLQSARIARALDAAGSDHAASIEAFLTGMIGRGDRCQGVGCGGGPLAEVAPAGTTAAVPAATAAQQDQGTE